MHLETLLPILASNADCIKALLENLSQRQAQFKPDKDSWSMLEVINHLCDEEKEDFRRRLRSLLQEPNQPLPSIKPEAWVMERNYNHRDLKDSVRLFLKERQKSIHWLESLNSPDWDSKYTTDSFSIRAGDIMASWAAHDHLHIRQLIEIWRQLLVQISSPYKIDYGGRW